MIDHFDKLERCVSRGNIPKDLAATIRNFFLSYGEAIEENGYSIEQVRPLLNQFLDLVVEQLQNPFVFEPFHQRITSPFDYYRFGLDLLRPLIVFSKSTVQGLGCLDAIEKALARGENVILLGNHQTEPDPQAISLLLENAYQRLAEEMIFVAGHRVVSDPLAVPFSKGRNLLCIFSKRHIETEPERKEERLSHNQKTMKKMVELLSKGGQCIYVAPSGGRDRPNSKGRIEVAPFDPQSIEMFRLMAQQSGKTAHFHPLALATYRLLPPPSSIEKELGERRHAHCTPIHLAFGPAMDMENFPGSECPDKKQRRQSRADYIWKTVAANYEHLLNK